MKQILTLFVMTQKGYAVLKKILSLSPGILAAVISARDSNLQQDYYEEIKQCSHDSGIIFHDRQDVYTITTPYAIAVSWRWLIQLIETKLIIFHDSLLPQYRGFNPLVTALIKGDDRIGVTALYAAKGYDSGDIIDQSVSLITYPMRIQDAINIISHNYEELTEKIARTLSEGKILLGRKQNESKASYSLWRDDDDYFIDWSQNSELIKRHIDAVGPPYKGAATTMGGRTVRVMDANTVTDLIIANRSPGKAIFTNGDKPIVVCGQGLLQVNELFDDERKTSLLPLKQFRTRFK